MGFSHRPVLLNETINSLNILPTGCYVDATAGGGGHSEEILKRLSSGRLVCLDQDPEAIQELGNKFKDCENVLIKKTNFSNMSSALDDLGIGAIDGALFDLGVSSHQFDVPERGFSYNYDSRIDMRMSKEGESAADLLSNLSEDGLREIIYRYGEEKYAGLIAKRIVAERERAPIETTGQLVEIIKRAIPASARRQGGHPAKRTFQALRIAVNNELDIIPEALESTFERMNAGGRIAIITFHSLEDKIVKTALKKFCAGCECPPDFPVCVCGKTPRAKIPFKAIRASNEEIIENRRSRSAKLRVVEKLK